MSKLAIASFFGGFCCLGLALIPIPFDRWVGVRQAGSVGAIACAYLGWNSSQRLKEEQEQFERWEFEQRQKQQAIDAAVNSAVTEVLVKEVVTKEELRVQASVEIYKAETQENFATVMAYQHPEIFKQLQSKSQPESESEPESDLENEAESSPENESKTEPKLVEESEEERISKAKALLSKLIKEHEGGWIGQLMQKPLLIYGDMGSYKSYFAAFLALCRHYLRGHQIVSIADPHFHQNKDESWKCLVSLGVPGYGANQNYFAVGEQLNAMYLRFATRTLKDVPLTSIWDEVTGYSSEEGTIEPGKKLVRKVVGDPRKANEAPILIGHDNTLIPLGGSEGFSKSRDRGIIQLEFYSDSENKPLFKGLLSGIKNGMVSLLMLIKCRSPVIVFALNGFTNYSIMAN